MRRLFTLLFVLLLAGCATSPYIDRTYTAASQGSRAQFLILHYTVGNFPSALKTLTEGGVSSHYLVRDDPPTIYQLVDDNRRAHHAGFSSWGGHTFLNNSSIGIEIVNQPVDGPGGRVYPEYPAAQIDAVIALVKKIVKEHGITPDRVLGHSDIAPQRKQDPGPRFPWKRLADEGLVVWPNAALVAEKKLNYEQEWPGVEWFQRKLARFGYAVPLNGDLDDATVSVLTAFQMKYRPALFDGMPDAETAAMLDVLTIPQQKTPVVRPTEPPIEQ